MYKLNKSHRILMVSVKSWLTNEAKLVQGVCGKSVQQYLLNMLTIRSKTLSYASFGARGVTLIIILLFVRI